LINAACVDHETYKFSSRFVLSLKENTCHINAFYDWAVKESLVYETIPIVVCLKCGKEGHVRKKCPDNQVRECYICGSQDHLASACPHPRSDDNMTCRRCHQRGHRAANCTLPYCKQCRTVNHTYEDCPAKRCPKCKVTGHRPDDPINCPKYQSCSKCGGNHSRKHCSADINRAFLLSANTTDTGSGRFETIERRYGTINPNSSEGIADTYVAEDDDVMGGAGVTWGDEAGGGANVTWGNDDVGGGAGVTWGDEAGDVAWGGEAQWT